MQNSVRRSLRGNAVLWFVALLLAIFADRAFAMTPAEFRESRLWVSAHFNMATYIPLQDDLWECAKGSESPDLFNPTDLDVDGYLDWVQKIGAKGFLITAMHVDGFCLWPSASSPHNVTASRWYREHGQRDVLREFLDGARKRALKVGYYFSMQDRYFEATNEVNPQTYTAAVQAHLRELLGGDYGPIDLVILDAWPWLAAANYTNLPYDDIYPFIKKLQPNCLVGINHHEHDGKHGDIDIYEQPAKIDGEPAPGKTAFPCVCCWSTLHQDGRWFGHSDLPPHVLSQADVLRARNKRMAEAGYVSIINVAPDPSGRLTEDEKQVLSRLGEQQ
jgi:alpha-L-fucosidase